MKNAIMNFLKNTRGVVMMEYVVMGVFAVAVVVVAVMAFGFGLTGDVSLLTQATSGETESVVDSKFQLSLATEDNMAQISEYDLFIYEQQGQEDPNKTKMGGKEKTIGLNAGD